MQRIKINQPMLDISKLKLADTPIELPLRRGYGTKGADVVLWTNYFQVKMAKADTTFHRYAIEVTPVIPRTQRRKKMQLIRLLLQTPQLSPLGDSIATDFGSTIITTKALHRDQCSASIVFRNEKEDTPSRNAQRYNIKITPTTPSSFSMSDFMDYLGNSNINATFPATGDLVQALNIVFGQHPKTVDEVMTIASNKHFAIGQRARAQDNFDLGAGLEAWRGYLVSVRVADNRLLLQLQVKHNASYKPGSLKGLIDEYQTVNGED